MAHSETSSSETKVNYQNNHGENLMDNNSKKPLTTDTDHYFGLLANPSKLKKDKSSSESSELENVMNNSDTSTDSSKSSKSSSNSSNSSKRNSRASDSRPKYDQIKIPAMTSTFNLLPHNLSSQNIRPNINNANANANANANVNANANANTLVDDEPVPKPLTAQEIKMKKIELLRKLCEIKSKGFQLSKEYDFNSSLEEMEYEYELLKSFADKRNGVKVFKNGLLQAVSVIEFLNDKYDPFDFHLAGWSDHLSIEVDSWEDVLEEIYEKYKGSGKKMAPEIKLLFLIVASASAFHFTKSNKSNIPGLDAVLSSNPGLLSNIIAGSGKDKKSQFMTAQEINLEKQRELLKQRELESKNKQIKDLQSQLKKKDDEMGPVPSNMKPIPVNQLRNDKGLLSGNIKAPEEVKSILSRIHNLQGNKLNNTDTQDETSSQNDRLLSDATISDTRGSVKKGANKKKSNINIL